MSLSSTYYLSFSPKILQIVLAISQADVAYFPCYYNLLVHASMRLRRTLRPPPRDADAPFQVLAKLQTFDILLDYNKQNKTCGAVKCSSTTPRANRQAMRTRSDAVCCSSRIYILLPHPITDCYYFARQFFKSNAKNN
jgi:hypothetical protein